MVKLTYRVKLPPEGVIEITPAGQQLIRENSQ
jgi:hypothetical protein